MSVSRAATSPAVQDSAVAIRRPASSCRHLIVDQRAVLRKDLARMVFAQDLQQLRVHRCRVRLVARDDLELSAPQAGGDLEPLEPVDAALAPRAASRPAPTRAARTSAPCPAGTPSGPRSPPAAQEFAPRCATSAAARAAAPAARRPSACPGPPRRARCRPDRGLCAPAGTMACLRLAARTASKSTSVNRARSRLRIAAIFSSSSSSSTSSRPQNCATTSTVISSAVGPSPPLVTIRSTPSSARKRSCAAMSSGRSPQIVMCASSTPSSSSRSAIHGPLRSCTRPVRTSVPVTTMPARALTNYAYTTTRSAAAGAAAEHSCMARTRMRAPRCGTRMTCLTFCRSAAAVVVRQLNPAQHLTQHDPHLDHRERRAEAAAVAAAERQPRGGSRRARRPFGRDRTGRDADTARNCCAPTRFRVRP